MPVFSPILSNLWNWAGIPIPKYRSARMPVPKPGGGGFACKHRPPPGVSTKPFRIHPNRQSTVRPKELQLSIQRRPGVPASRRSQCPGVPASRRSQRPGVPASRRSQRPGAFSSCCSFPSGAFSSCCSLPSGVPAAASSCPPDRRP